MLFKDLRPALPRLKRAYGGSPVGALSSSVVVTCSYIRITDSFLPKYDDYTVVSVRTNGYRNYPKIIVELKMPE